MTFGTFRNQQIQEPLLKTGSFPTEINMFFFLVWDLMGENHSICVDILYHELIIAIIAN